MAYSVALIILYNSDNRCLLQHRSKDAPILPDYWAFFGGSIEPDETPEDAVRREALEELDYRLRAPRLFLEQDFTIDELHGHMYVFIEAFQGDSSRIKLLEGQGLGWFRSADIHKLKMIHHDRQLILKVTDYLETYNPKGDLPK